MNVKELYPLLKRTPACNVFLVLAFGAFFFVVYSQQPEVPIAFKHPIDAGVDTTKQDTATVNRLNAIAKE